MARWWFMGLGLVLLAGLAAGLYLLNPDEPDPVPEPAGDEVDAQARPDYTMEDFTATAMGEDGHPAHRLTAEHMAHYETEDRSFLEAPLLTFHDAGVLTWTVRSADGTILPGREWVHLEGDVIIIGYAPDSSVHTRITTEYLAVRPEARYAETNVYIHMERVEGTKESVGAKIDLEGGHVELLTRVRGRYETETPGPQP